MTTCLFWESTQDGRPARPPRLPSHSAGPPRLPNPATMPNSWSRWLKQPLLPWHVHCCLGGSSGAPVLVESLAEAAFAPVACALLSWRQLWRPGWARSRPPRTAAETAKSSTGRPEAPQATPWNQTSGNNLWHARCCLWGSSGAPVLVEMLVEAAVAPLLPWHVRCCLGGSSGARGGLAADPRTAAETAKSSKGRPEAPQATTRNQANGSNPWHVRGCLCGSSGAAALVGWLKQLWRPCSRGPCVAVLAAALAAHIVHQPVAYALLSLRQLGRPSSRGVVGSLVEAAQVWRSCTRHRGLCVAVSAAALALLAG